jgi:hypothetical protein
VRFVLAQRISFSLERSRIVTGIEPNPAATREFPVNPVELEWLFYSLVFMCQWGRECVTVEVLVGLGLGTMFWFFGLGRRLEIEMC